MSWRRKRRADARSDDPTPETSTTSRAADTPTSAGRPPWSPAEIEALRAAVQESATNADGPLSDTTDDAPSSRGPGRPDDRPEHTPSHRNSGDGRARAERP